MTIIKVPDELAHEIDRLAGAKKRSAYATDVLWREVRRNRQREALRASAGSWKAGDHPELARAEPLTSKSSAPSVTVDSRTLSTASSADGNHSPRYAGDLRPS